MPSFSSRGPIWALSLFCLGFPLALPLTLAGPKEEDKKDAAKKDEGPKEKDPKEKAPEAPEKGPQAVLLRHLRGLAAAEPGPKGTSLRGVFLRDVKIRDAKGSKDKVLALEGIYDQKEQLGALTAAASQFIKVVPAFEGFSDKVDTAGMEKLSVRRDLLPLIQEKFASSQVADPEGPDFYTRVRLDDVYFHSSGEEVVFTGLGLMVKDADKGMAAARLKKALETILLTDLAPQLGPLTINVASVRFLENPLLEFQTKFIDGLGLENILIERAQFGPQGQLLLKGWYDRKTAPKFPALFLEHFRDHPAVALPGTAPHADLKAMEAIDWPIRRKEWNEELNRSDKHRTSHLRRMVFKTSDEGKLVFYVDALFEGREKDEYEGELDKWLKNKLALDWSALKNVLNNRVQFNSLRDFGELRRDLQADVFRVLSLKDVLLESVRFDAEGILEVEGLIGAEEQRDQFAKNEKKLATAWQREGISFKKLRVEDWPARLKQLQAALATDPNPLLKRTRVDRISLEPNQAYLASSDSKSFLLELHLHGVLLHEESASPKTKEDGKGAGKEGPDAPWEELKEKLQTRIEGVWPQMEKLIRGRISSQGIKPLPPPERLLQGGIGDEPRLDGVFLSGSVFNPEGKLLLQGKWRGPGQKDALEALADDLFARKAPELSKRGLVLDKLELVPTDKVLAELDEYGSALTETSIDRLFFDPKGELVLQGRYLGEEAIANKEKVYKELKALLRSRPETKDLKVVLPPELAPKAPKEPEEKKCEASAPRNWSATVTLALATETPSWALTAFGPPDKKEEDKAPPSLVQHLREKVLVASDPNWDGVLIRRGLFKGGRFYLDGLVSNEKQREALQDVLNKLRAFPEWRDYLKKDFKEETAKLEVLNNDAMVHALRELLPDYEEFDRIRIERAYHVYHFDETAKKTEWKLELLVYSTERKDKIEDRKDKAEELLTKLVNTDRDHRARLGKGVRLKVESVAANRPAARVALARALALMIEEGPGTLNPADVPLPGPALWGYVGCTPVLILAPPAAAPPAPRPVPKLDPPEPASIARFQKARAYLDVVLFHMPEESAAWFLRGAAYLGEGESFHAKRDLRRMNQVEFDHPEARELRLLALHLYQGPLRLAASELATEEGIAVALGWRRRSLEEALAYVVRK